MPGNVAPLPLRILRLTRLLIHLLAGLWIVRLHYPRMSPQRRRQMVRAWSRRLLRILAISVHAEALPAALPGRCMLVTNHISWLDIFVIDSLHPAIFVAKSEIRSWPLVGWLCARVGTLYIERGKGASARRLKERLTHSLASGVLIAVCPEGVTTYGRTLERFHAALFQPVIDAAATLQPVALRYQDPRGRHTDAAGYVGETSLLESTWRIVSARRIIVRVEFLGLLPAEGETRRTLAGKAEGAIAAALGVAAPQPRR